MEFFFFFVLQPAQTPQKRKKKIKKPSYFGKKLSFFGKGSEKTFLFGKEGLSFLGKRAPFTCRPLWP